MTRARHRARIPRNQKPSAVSYSSTLATVRVPRNFLVAHILKLGHVLPGTVLRGASIDAKKLSAVLLVASCDRCFAFASPDYRCIIVRQQQLKSPCKLFFHQVPCW
jgi:hypothetical protein